jgi:hypothetical protein
MKRRGPGRPKGTKTTGSKTTKPIFYRVSESERAALEAEAAKRGLEVNALAKALALASIEVKVS